MRNKIIQGDSAEKLKKLEDNSIDSMVTDPPYFISFMNKKWDGNHGSRDESIKWLTNIMKETYRVLKPGAHICVFGATRTCHYTMCAIEDAGFEIRDTLHWTFSSGFPKSHNIYKALQKSHPEEAERYRGVGTSLKPSHEIIVLARKPLSEKTIAKNVLKHGTGGLNIDSCRVGIQGKDDRSAGRFPANMILECICEDGYVQKTHTNPECPCAVLDEQSGECGNGWKKNYGEEDYKGNQYKGGTFGGGWYRGNSTYCDKGGASRFFQQIEQNLDEAPPFYYCAKAPTKERNIGFTKDEVKDGYGNNHPTLKPLKLMSYLIKLITPPKGVVLDPFAGSGSTLVAAEQLGFKYVGIEKEKEYVEIIKKRLAGVKKVANISL
jgi:DNA modification methylase